MLTLLACWLKHSLLTWGERKELDANHVRREGRQDFLDAKETACVKGRAVLETANLLAGLGCRVHRSGQTQKDNNTASHYRAH